MICKAVQGLIDHSVSSGLITEEDYFVVRNMIMDMNTNVLIVASTL